MVVREIPMTSAKVCAPLRRSRRRPRPSSGAALQHLQHRATATTLQRDASVIRTAPMPQDSVGITQCIEQESDGHYTENREKGKLTSS
jgi:hypothetical protein